MATKKKKLNGKLTKNTTKKPAVKVVKKKTTIKKKTTKPTSPKVIQPKREEKKLKGAQLIEAPSIKLKEKQIIEPEIIKEAVKPITEEKPIDKPIEKKKRILKKIISPLTIIPILLILIGAIAINLYKEENPKPVEKNYAEYKIGDKIRLADDSIWYVIEDSDKNKSYAVILSSTPADLDDNNEYNSNDYYPFDKDNKSAYNESEPNNIGHYLINTFRYKLTNIGGIKKVRLLTSSEYVKIREAMKWDYEWEEENWLAGKSIGYWWLNSSQNGKVYVVNNRGSYSLQAANKQYYVRPVIEINKSEMKKEVVPKEETEGE